MSARRLQQPAPTSVSEYKRFGTNIVTTLAILPQGSEGGIPESNPRENEPPGKQPNNLHGTLPNVLGDTDPVHTRAERSSAPSNRAELPDEGACGGDAMSKSPISASMNESPDRFLDVESIVADFNGSHIPVFIRPETRTDPPNVPAVREILEAYEQGSPVKALIKANFPEGDFQYHLITYLRNRARIWWSCHNRSFEESLMNAYVIGVKEWCAAALDVFLSQTGGNHTTPAESGEAADGQQGSKLTLGSQHSFFEEVALYQRRSHAKRVPEDDSKCFDEWRKYKKSYGLTRPSSTSTGKADTISIEKELRFVSDSLRDSHPGTFLLGAVDVARILKRFGAPRPLINLVLTLRLCSEDVVEYERVEKLVHGADGTDLQEITTTPVVDRLDLPRSTTYMCYPLDVVSPLCISGHFNCFAIPPFLQLGYGSGDCRTEAISRMIELWERREHDKALSVMDQEFQGAEQFHEQLFSCLRRAMQSYGVPKLSKGVRACNLGIPLQKYLQIYAKGLQQWCARAHGALAQSFDDAIDHAYLFDTEESSNFIETASEMASAYTRSVNWLMSQIDLSQMGVVPPPPKTSLELLPEVEELRESIYTLDWLMQKMRWDCFLSFRVKLAQLVREIDRGHLGFSFLVNVLESLSFTDNDVDDFKKCRAEMLRRDLLRLRQYFQR